MSDFDYDVFISYSRADAEWAERLEEALDAKQVRCFRDSTRLAAGESWNPQLIAALRRSQHLAVLWSRNARDSDWVTKELARFDAITDLNGEGTRRGRRLFFVFLEDENTAWADVQAITDIREAGLYAGGVDAAGDVWDRVVKRIADPVQADDGSIAVPVLLITSTRERMDDVEPTQAPAAGPPLADLAQDLGIASVEVLLSSYGASRSDWRPFGSERNVAAILEQLKDDLNGVIAEMGDDRPRLRWDFVADDFWTSSDAAERDVRRLRTSPAVVVVDPVSFYDPLVVNRYGNFLPEVLHNERAFLLVLAPFALPSTARALRDAIRAFALQVFMHFYEPPAFRGRNAAGCSASVGDEVEFRGWLMAALASRLAPAAAGPVSYLRQQ
jgi:hypothetical protein